MTASYVFNSDSLITLSRYVAADTLFVFDLEGIMAPIVKGYTTTKVEEPVRTTLERLIKLAKVVVFTGRSRNSALSILGFEPHLLIGNHGAEWPPHESSRNWPFIECCLKWREQLHGMLFFYAQGVEIEFKGESISLHYRKADDPEKAITLINAAIEKLVPVPRRIEGECVVNLLPMEAFTKGKALLTAIDKFGLKRAIYFGTDVISEEVFQLKSVDVLGIRVTNDDHSAAAYYLNSPSEILRLLNSMIGILELHCDEGESSGD